MIIYRLMWPLYIYEIFLGLSHRLTGWSLVWLIVFTVIASVQFVVKRG